MVQLKTFLTRLDDIGNHIIYYEINDIMLNKDEKYIANYFLDSNDYVIKNKTLIIKNPSTYDEAILFKKTHIG